MDVLGEVRAMLGDVLGLGSRAASLKPESHLLGVIPELDSLAVVGLISYMEERLGIQIDDDDIDAETFGTVGTLVEFVRRKLTA